MPFDPEFDAIYSELVKPALENAGYEVDRADSLMNQQNILKDIIRNIAKADLVVAELTALNSNVFYELGIAHALRRRTIMITQSIDDLPFDLKSYRVVPYSARFDEIRELSKTLTGIAQKARTDSIDFGNPIIDFLPSEHGPENSAKKTQENHIAAKDISHEPEEEKGIWDFIIDGESNLQKATEALSRLSQAITDIGQRMTARTTEVQNIQKSGGAGTAGKIYKVVEQAAGEILDFAQKVEVELPGFRSAWDIASGSITGMLHTSSLNTPEDMNTAIQFKEVLVTLSSQITASTESIRGLRNSQAQMQGISKSMNRATRKATSALDQVLAEFEKSLSYTTKATDLVDEMLNDYRNGHGA